MIMDTLMQQDLGVSLGRPIVGLVLSDPYGNRRIKKSEGIQDINDVEYTQGSVDIC